MHKEEGGTEMGGLMSRAPLLVDVEGGQAAGGSRRGGAAESGAGKEPPVRR